jgi:superfamily II DNA helicase RecQ
VRQKAPPYVIFSDRTLAEIATVKPADTAALSRVSGVGETKLARYGPAVLAMVAGEVPPGD